MSWILSMLLPPEVALPKSTLTLYRLLRHPGLHFPWSTSLITCSPAANYTHYNRKSISNLLSMRVFVYLSPRGSTLRSTFSVLVLSSGWFLALVTSSFARSPDCLGSLSLSVVWTRVVPRLEYCLPVDYPLASSFGLRWPSIDPRLFPGVLFCLALSIPVCFCLTLACVDHV